MGTPAHDRLFIGIVVREIIDREGIGNALRCIAKILVSERIHIVFAMACDINAPAVFGSDDVYACDIAFRNNFKIIYCLDILLADFRIAGMGREEGFVEAAGEGMMGI